METVLFYLALYVLYMLVTIPYRKCLPEYSFLDWTAHFIMLMILVAVVSVAIDFVVIGLGFPTNSEIVIGIHWVFAFLCGWNMPMPITKTGKIPPDLKY